MVLESYVDSWYICGGEDEDAQSGCSTLAAAANGYGVDYFTSYGGLGFG